MAYDPTNSILVMFGGATYDTSHIEHEFSDTWFWRDTGSWCKLSPTCP
jgi:hypothetical protein